MRLGRESEAVAPSEERGPRRGARQRPWGETPPRSDLELGRGAGRPVPSPLW